MKNLLKKIVLVTIFFVLSINVFSQSGWDTLPWKSYADYRYSH